MLNIIKKWASKYFANEEALILILLSLVAVIISYFIGNVLVPIFVALALAYLLQGGVKRLVALRVPRLLAVALIELFFVLVLFVVALVLLPSVWEQFKNFLNELPKMLANIQAAINGFVVDYPEWISPSQVEDLNLLLQNEITSWAKQILSFSMASLSNIVTLMVYVVLIPVLIFFFLKDKEKILGWIKQFLPQNRPFMSNLSREMDLQISNYVRGKAIEIFLVGIVCFIILSLFDIRYTILLSVLTGLSVLVPYFGAMAIGLMVMGVAFFQFGLSAQFMYIVVSYAVLQILDGNVLVPILFSEVVNLHPVAILLAVLFFGGLWGFWGLFFAIPLATFVNALINSWPREADES